MFVWSLAYNMSELSGPTRNMKILVGIPCKIIETHMPLPEHFEREIIHRTIVQYIVDFKKQTSFMIIITYWF